MVVARSRKRAPRAHLPHRARKARRARGARGAAARRGERRARPAAAAPRTTRARRPARGQRARRGPGPPRDRNTRTVELRTGLRAPHLASRRAADAAGRGCARAASRRLRRRRRLLTTAPEHYFGSDAPRHRRPPDARCQFYAKLRAGGDAICTVDRGSVDEAARLSYGGKVFLLRGPRASGPAPRVPVSTRNSRTAPAAHRGPCQ
ncbi:hypothetical protein RR48_07618 [Papilio machaon]|uniref:Uncharacterized protein n=1 Tax=Papilio machaon TaxID=76193 RepID=A0A194QNW0_PAPMA|nr:hypothetical protein RR48_07618 [Papilio machaon]